MGAHSGISNKYCGCCINTADETVYCLCCEDSKCTLRHMLELMPRLCGDDNMELFEALALQMLEDLSEEQLKKLKSVLYDLKRGVDKELEE